MLAWSGGRGESRPRAPTEWSVNLSVHSCTAPKCHDGSALLFQGSLVDAWVCRNFRHVVSVCRFGAGGIFRALRTRRMVDAPTRWPSFSSSPLDPLVSPAVVLGGELFDERGDLGVGRRPSRPVGVGPFTSDQAAAPAQDGAGGDQPVHPQTCRQEPDQRGEDRASRPSGLNESTGTVTPTTRTSSYSRTRMANRFCIVDLSHEHD
jgi:hypothetical protein